MSLKEKIDRIVYWYKPSIGIVKLNTDGSVQHNGKGAGGIIRDTNGDLILAYALNLHK